MEEDENAEKKKIELEEIENTKKAGKLRKQKRNAKFPDTNFEFEKPWEWQFFYLKKNRGIFKKGAGVSQHNLVQVLFILILFFAFWSDLFSLKRCSTLLLSKTSLGRVKS